MIEDHLTARQKLYMFSHMHMHIVIIAIEYLTTIVYSFHKLYFHFSKKKNACQMIFMYFPIFIKFFFHYFIFSYQKYKSYAKFALLKLCFLFIDRRIPNVIWFCLNFIRSPQKLLKKYWTHHGKFPKNDVSNCFY